MLNQCARISRLPATLLALPSANPRFATPLQSHAYECLDKQVQSNDILTNYRGGTPHSDRSNRTWRVSCNSVSASRCEGSPNKMRMMQKPVSTRTRGNTHRGNAFVRPAVLEIDALKIAALQINAHKVRALHIAAFLIAALLAIFAPPALRTTRAQNPDDIMPAASAAKAKAIMAQAITALGGDAYLKVRNSDCKGRAAQFEHSGGVVGYVQFHDYRQMPDKNRMEYGPKGNIVNVYAGKEGWTLDRGGVSDVPAQDMADYQETSNTDVNTILRYRMNDSSLVFRYSGADVVDLKEADWVEIADHEGHTIRIAFDRKTGLPIRTVVSQREAETGDRIQRSTYYNSYHVIDGIQTPFQVSRFRNDQQTYQVFYESCQYNTELAPEMFTRASLDSYFASTAKKGKGNKK